MLSPLARATSDGISQSSSTTPSLRLSSLSPRATMAHSTKLKHTTRMHPTFLMLSLSTSSMATISSTPSRHNRSPAQAHALRSKNPPRPPAQVSAPHMHMGLLHLTNLYQAHHVRRHMSLSPAWGLSQRTVSLLLQLMPARRSRQTHLHRERCGTRTNSRHSANW